jgi:CBS domain-containing protein
MKTFVKDVMTTKVIWVERDTPFAAIAAALHQYRVSAFPVLDEAGQVIGVVSESDLLSKLALGGGEDGRPGTISGILHQHEMEKARAATADELMTSPAATISPDDTPDAARFDVAVADGVVTLTGRPRTRQQGRDIVRRARHTVGVVAVRDRLDYPAARPSAFDTVASFPVD